jgi:pyruvate dehydrogenase E2 component (dihydrolipoamide acetyltransferase)
MPTTASASPATATEFRMPSLGADMKFGTVVAWLVKPGDRVKRGDVVAEVETEKGVFEVEIGNGGIIDEISVAKGTKVPVGAVLARLRGEELGGGIVPAVEPPQLGAPTPAASVSMPAPAVPKSVEPSLPTVPPVRAVRASPLARKIAESMGIDLAHVTGTGPSGAITKADVERAASGIASGVAAPAAAKRPEVLAPPVGPPPSDALLAMRHAVATAVSRAKREIPHYYLGCDVNLASALAWLAPHNATRTIADRVLPAALLLRSVALALRTHPDLNGFWIDGAHRAAEAIHLGVAISLRGGGLIAPAIHDADRLSIDDLMHALSDLVRRARSGGLRSSEMMDATVTVSNLGDEGAATVFGIIYPPQVALVGFGKINERPWAENGMIGVRPVVTMSLAADHRATDGHYGGRFLAEVDRLLQEPESL